MQGPKNVKGILWCHVHVSLWGSWLLEGRETLSQLKLRLNDGSIMLKESKYQLLVSSLITGLSHQTQDSYSVLDFYCCIISFCKPSGLQQHTLIILQFCKLESGHSMCLDFLLRVTLNGHQGVHSGLWFSIRVLKCSSRIEFLGVVGLRTPFFLLAISWGMLSAFGGCPQFLAMWLPQAVHMKVCSVLGQPVSVILPSPL